jgi:hypothetical protein
MTEKKYEKIKNKETKKKYDEEGERAYDNEERKKVDSNKRKKRKSHFILLSLPCFSAPGIHTNSVITY